MSSCLFKNNFLLKNPIYILTYMYLALNNIQVLISHKTQPDHCPVTGAVECRGIRLSQWVSWYDTKQSDGKVPVMLELWRKWINPSYLLLPDQLWSRVKASDRVLPVGQIELNCLFMLNWIVWNRTVFDILLFVNKNYTCTKFNCLKFILELNDLKRVDML